uniref:Uncharacterized protein n=1 Tax=Falco tinnunculus TaxID=100819 RepID=A0A8C4UNI3_FALTI
LSEILNNFYLSGFTEYANIILINTLNAILFINPSSLTPSPELFPIILATKPLLLRFLMSSCLISTIPL